MSTDERKSNKNDSSHRNKSYECSKSIGEKISGIYCNAPDGCQSEPVNEECR